MARLSFHIRQQLSLEYQEMVDSIKENWENQGMVVNMKQRDGWEYQIMVRFG